MADSTITTDKPGDQRVSISLTTRPLLSCAMAHNGVRVVDTVVLSASDVELRGATVRLKLRDATGPVGVPHEMTVDVTAGERAVYRDVTVRLDPAAMMQVEEQRPGVVRSPSSSTGSSSPAPRRPCAYWPPTSG